MVDELKWVIVLLKDVETWHRAVELVRSAHHHLCQVLKNPCSSSGGWGPFTIHQHNGPVLILAMESV